MKHRMAQNRALAAGAMIFGLGVSGAMAFPDDKAKEQGGDLSAILEKLPPDIREKLLAEIERLRVEAEKLKVDSLERAERLKSDAAKKIEEMKRDAQERLEQVEVQLRSKAESAEAAAKEQILKARAQAELAKAQAQEAAAKARTQAEKLHAEHAGDHTAEHHAEGDHVTKKSVTEERTVIVRAVPGGDGKNAEAQEMRVEIVKGDGQDKPVVRIFKDGKEVKADQLPGGFVIEDMPKVDVLREAANLEKLPPEKRAEIEKAQDELKAAQDKLRIAAEKLAKLQGGKQGNVMIFRSQAGVPIEVRPFMGDRVPGVPLPPGAVGRADRLPRPPLPPMPPQPPASPELEKRISKAEKALDDILLELKKLQDNKNDGEDDDDEKEEKGEKKPARDKNERRRDSGEKARVLSKN